MKIHYGTLIKEISDKTRVTQKDVKEIVDSTFQLIIEHISQGEPVNIGKIGTFGFSIKEETKIPNLHLYNQGMTEEKTIVPRQRTMKFYPSKSTKSTVKEIKDV